MLGLCILCTAAAAASSVVGTSTLAGPGSTATAAGYLAPRRLCRGQANVAAPAIVQKRSMRCLVNYARRRRGLAPLRASAALESAALARAVAIRSCNDFSHTPCGQEFLVVYVRSGYLRATGQVGENLAYCAGYLGSARSAMAQWLASAGHRANLFGRGWVDFGVAFVKSARLFGGVNVEVWVVNFGRRG
jgi:uncharacterized protein YkwD